MIHFNYRVKRKKYSGTMPSGWHDVSLELFYRLQDWNAASAEIEEAGGEAHLTSLFGHLTGIPKKHMAQMTAKDFLPIMNQAGQWAEHPLDVEKLEKPDFIEIDGYEFVIGEDLNMLSFGQFLALQQNIHKDLDDVERTALTIAIVMFYELEEARVLKGQDTDKPGMKDRRKFSVKAARYFVPMIKKARFVEAYPVELFFWKALSQSGKNRKSGFLKRLLTRMRRLLALNRWPRSVRSA